MDVGSGRLPRGWGEFGQKSQCNESQDGKERAENARSFKRFRTAPYMLALLNMH